MVRAVASARSIPGIAFPAGFKIYLAVEPVDMRKKFNGLWALAGEKLLEDPKSGAVFCFCNKDRDRVKLLYRPAARQLAASCVGSFWASPSMTLAKDPTGHIPFSAYGVAERASSRTS
jgi:hypothetical protein